jgi:hypothetical protein
MRDRMHTAIYANCSLLLGNRLRFSEKTVQSLSNILHISTFIRIHTKVQNMQFLKYFSIGVMMDFMRNVLKN